MMKELLTLGVSILNGLTASHGVSQC